MQNVKFKENEKKNTKISVSLFEFVFQLAASFANTKLINAYYLRSFETFLHFTG